MAHYNYINIETWKDGTRTGFLQFGDIGLSVDSTSFFIKNDTDGMFFTDIIPAYVKSLGMELDEGLNFILSSITKLGDCILYAIQDPRVQEIIAQGELGEEGIPALEEYIASHT